MRKESALPGGWMETDAFHNSPETQKALQVTWVLNGHLKNAQIAYLRVAVLLAQVRDEKLYAAMKHDDIVSYAADHLHLSETSLHRYLRIHDWVKGQHPEWLESKPKGHIPDLSDIDDLIWIEGELGRKGLSEKKEKALKELQTKALSGDLKRSDLRAFRKGNRKSSDGLRRFLSALRTLTRRGAGLAGMPQEVIAHLEAAIGILVNLAKQA